MERRQLILQIYATLVNVVVIITFIICLGDVISNLLDKSDPMLAARSSEKLSSYEMFKMETMRSVSKDQAYLPSDAELKEMYDASLQREIDKVLHRVNRSISVSSILILVCIALFIPHWRILRKIYSTDKQ